MTKTAIFAAFAVLALSACQTMKEANRQYHIQTAAGCKDALQTFYDVFDAHGVYAFEEGTPERRERECNATQNTPKESFIRAHECLIDANGGKME